MTNPSETPYQAHIMAVAVASYLPSDRDVQTFWEKESTREKVPETLPLGFPKYLKSSLAWIGSEVLQREDEWTLCLTEDEVASVNAALAKFEGKQLMTKDGHSFDD